MKENCQYSYNFLNYSINYYEWGHGTHNLFCFHGFAQSAKEFAFLNPEFEKQYKIYAFDFLYHGETVITSESNTSGINKSIWTELISSFLVSKNIDRLSLIGYSMGGRLSLSLIEAIPEKIDNIILLAPDGVWNSFWFNFATKNYFGKKLFKSFTYTPKPFYAALNILVKLKILPAKLIQIANHNTSNEYKRIQVYNTWGSLTQIRSDRKLIESNLNKFDIHLHVVAGKYDQVIPLKKLKQWSWIKKNPTRLSVVNCGHLIPNEEISSRLREVQ